MGTQKMLRVIRRHILEAFFSGDESRKLSQRAKTIEKKISTSTESAGNPVGITKPSLLSLFVQPDKKFWEQSTKVKETYFLTISDNISMKDSLAVKTCIKTH